MIHQTWHKRTARRFLVGFASAAVLSGTAIGYAGHSHADTIQQCKTDGWGFLFSQRRQLCDGPVHPDGSWLRRRIIYVPPHQVPLSCSTYGGYYYASTNCSGGYYQPYAEISNETYPVTPDTVLGDEPGHLV